MGRRIRSAFTLSMTSLTGIHVLTLTPFYPSQGDARGSFVSEPLQQFAEMGLRSTVLAVRPFYKNRVVSSTTAPPAAWIRYPAIPGNMGLASSGRFLFQRLRSHVRQLHQEDPVHILHAHAPLPCGEAARLLGDELHIPVVVTVHGLDAYFTEQINGVSGERCAQVCERLYQHAQRVVCISEEVRRHVTARVPALQNLDVVYNGADPDVFFPAQDPPYGDPIVVAIGTLIRSKGHDITLRAVAELSGEFPRLRARVIGEGPELANLQNLVRQLGVAERVEFLGRQTRSEIATILRGGQIFALPSHYEGLGCVYLEAMASGLPVIAYRGQGIQEVIRHNDNGILLSEHTPENEPRALAAVLQTLLKKDDMRRNMGLSARRTIVGGYTLRHQAQGLARIFESIRREYPA